MSQIATNQKNSIIRHMGKNKKPTRPTTQKYLDIQQIKEDIVVLKDGSLRAIALVSSINFALKSYDEQQATIQAYMQFLNGLEYPIQVVINSRKMNIEDYIKRMRKTSLEQTNELLKEQTADYIKFIEDLVAEGEIMSKRFYIIVPYDPISDKKKSFWPKFQEVLSPGKRIRLNDKEFAKRAHELDQRMAQTLGALRSMSLTGVRLDTQGLIELYYNVYNPIISQSQPLKNVGDIDIDSSYGF